MPQNVVLPQFLAVFLLMTSTVVWKRGLPPLDTLRQRFSRWLKSLLPARRPCRSHAIFARGARSWLDC